uniref:Uncharacterized protein n=1 Tax=Romanomermis culicivorax TaxID=13658 RepID=A0A915KA80_ROMCU
MEHLHVHYTADKKKPFVLKVALDHSQPIALAAFSTNLHCLGVASNEPGIDLCLIKNISTRGSSETTVSTPSLTRTKCLGGLSHDTSSP